MSDVKIRFSIPETKPDYDYGAAKLHYDPNDVKGDYGPFERLEVFTNRALSAPMNAARYLGQVISSAREPSSSEYQAERPGLLDWVEIAANFPLRVGHNVIESIRDGLAKLSHTGGEMLIRVKPPAKAAPVEALHYLKNAVSADINVKAYGLEADQYSKAALQKVLNEISDGTLDSLENFGAGIELNSDTHANIVGFMRDQLIKSIKSEDEGVKNTSFQVFLLANRKTLLDGQGASAYYRRLSSVATKAENSLVSEFLKTEGLFASKRLTEIDGKKVA